MAIVAKQTSLWTALKQWVQNERPTWGTCAGLILLSASISSGKAEQDLLGGLDVHVARNAFGAQLSSFEGAISIEETLVDWNVIQQAVCAAEPAQASRHQHEHHRPPAGPRSTVTSSYEAAISAVCIPQAAAKHEQHTQESGTAVEVGIFIRAPAILAVGAGASVLATVQPPPPRGASLLASLPKTSQDMNSSSQHRVIVAAAKRSGHEGLPVLLGTAFHPELTPSLKWHAYFAAMVKAYINKSKGNSQPSRMSDAQASADATSA